MASITVDQLQVLVTANTKQLQKSFDQINKQLDDVQGSTSKFSAKSAALFGVVAGAAQALVNKGINLISSSIGGAVKRVDTLNNSQRVFKNLGFSAADTKVAMDRLNASITGLPTSLDDAVRGVQTLAATQGDIKLAQKTFQALNDGILAMGGSADMVNGAILQLSQLPMDGPMDAQTWNSLRQNGLTPVFTAMAKEGHMSVSQLKEDFGSGKLTVQDFTDMLIKMDEKGGGGMASLQKQVRDATKGIGTSFANFQTAVTRSVANVIKVIGAERFSGAINKAASIVDDVSKELVKKIPGIESSVKKAFDDTMKKVFELKGLITSGNIFAAGKQIGQGIGNGVATAIKAIRLTVDVLKNWFAGIDWGQLGIQVGTGALAFVGGLVVGLFSTDSLMQFVDFIADNWVQVLLTVATVAFAPAKLLGPFGKLFGGIIAKIPFGEFFLSGLTKVIGVIRDIGAPVRAAFSSAVTTPIKNLVETLIIRLMLIMDKVKAVMLAPFELSVKAIVGVINGLVSFIKIVVVNIKNIFAPIADWLGGLFGRAVSKIKAPFNSISGFLGNIVNGIKSRFSPLTSWFSSKFNGIKNLISKINWESVGIDIIKGIGNGIKNMGGWLADKAKSAVGAAKDKLKSFLGIHSPSRVMRDEVGKMIGLGMAEGIDDTSKNVMSSMKDLSNLSVGNFDIGSGSLDASVSRDIMPSTGQPTQIIVKIGEDTILDKMIDGINGKSFLSGASVLNI